MRNFLKLSAVLMLLLFISPAYAVIVLKCKDEKGSISYQQDFCPPGTSAVNEKKYGTDTDKPPANPDISAILYVIPDCDVCQEVRDFLTMRKIPFTEKNVDGNLAGQKELKEKTGELKVPVTIIGKSIIKGYNRQQLLDALKTAGQVETEPEPEAEAEAENNPEQESEDQAAIDSENQQEPQADSEQTTEEN